MGHVCPRGLNCFFLKQGKCKYNRRMSTHFPANATKVSNTITCMQQKCTQPCQTPECAKCIMHAKEFRTGFPRRHCRNPDLVNERYPLGGLSPPNHHHFVKVPSRLSAPSFYKSFPNLAADRCVCISPYFFPTP